MWGVVVSQSRDFRSSIWERESGVGERGAGHEDVYVFCGNGGTEGGDVGSVTIRCVGAVRVSWVADGVVDFRLS
jgi:hypothetical protein